MFPLVDPDGDNPLELFQIWLNLPAEDKLVPPHFTMLWDEDIPRHVASDEAGRTTVVTVIAGRLADADAPAPPPHSWASRADADLAIWHLRLDPGATWSLPPATGPDTVRTAYVFEGSLGIGGHDLPAETAALVRADAPVAISAGRDGAEVLVLQGRPIAEPVAQAGPFVMNTETEIREAFADYRATGFGGWPFAADDPVHDREQGRFARHADQVVEVPPSREPVS
jgi:redox-sensitive bicupin YhaK (pirin superfamily)